MRNYMAIFLTAATMIFGGTTYAAQVNGTLTYMYMSGYGPSGVSCGMLVNGLFYYYNGPYTSFIASIDLARRTKGGVVSFSADPTSRLINGAY